MSRPYPFPYGFVIDTLNADGDCLDCFVITRQVLRTGDIVECEAIGLMQQVEDGLADDKVLARLAVTDEAVAVTSQVQRTLGDFVQNVFGHFPDRTIRVREFLDADHAQAGISECRPLLRVVEEPLAALSQHARISIAFTVDEIADVSYTSAGTYRLESRPIDGPYIKDYDTLESPKDWADRFDLSNWGLLAAYQGGWRVGGAVVARATAGVALLEGRTDMAVLWDIRVRAEVRGRGVGTRLFRAAEEWAFGRGCSELRIETQNVNVGACRFYERHGCTLVAANRNAYQALPDEIQLLWSKDLTIG